MEIEMVLYSQSQPISNLQTITAQFDLNIDPMSKFAFR